MTSRPLHAVQFPPSAGERMLAALAAALDGSGPAILPLDPDLPEAALARTLAAFAPAAIAHHDGNGCVPRTGLAPERRGAVGGAPDGCPPDCGPDCAS